MSVRKRTWTTASGETKTAWMVDYADNHGERQRKHFPNKKAADKFRISVEHQMQGGTYRASADKATVSVACRHFLIYCEGRNERDERMTRKMLTVYRGHINNHILHPEHGVSGFPNREGHHLGHDNLIKRQSLPLFDLLPTVKRFSWHGLRHFAVSCWIEAG